MPCLAGEIGSGRHGQAGGELDEVDLAAAAGLVEDPEEMRLHGAPRDAEDFDDLALRPAVGDQLEYARFRRRQIIEKRESVSRHGWGVGGRQEDRGGGTLGQTTAELTALEWQDMEDARRPHPAARRDADAALSQRRLV